MTCNLASDLASQAVVWTVTDHVTGRFIQGVPAHKVPAAMRQLEAKRPSAT
jgi:hypothetical protein